MSWPHAHRALRLLLTSLVLAACPSIGYGDTHAAPAPSSDCSRCAEELRGALEGVIEPVIRFEKADLHGAGQRASAVWSRCRVHVPDSLGVDRLMSAMSNRIAINAPATLELAAERALQVSALSLTWCGDSTSVEQDLARVDLLGQAAWLRARGLDPPLPDGREGAVKRLAARLRARHKTGLALELEVRSARAEAGTSAGDALDLLDLVDRIETALIATRG